jgi:hypothetical protein
MPYKAKPAQYLAMSRKNKRVSTFKEAIEFFTLYLLPIVSLVLGVLGVF